MEATGRCGLGRFDTLQGYGRIMSVHDKRIPGIRYNGAHCVRYTGLWPSQSIMQPASSRMLQLLDDMSDPHCLRDDDTRLADLVGLKVGTGACACRFPHHTRISRQCVQDLSKGPLVPLRLSHPGYRTALTHRSVALVMASTSEMSREGSGCPHSYLGAWESLWTDGSLMLFRASRSRRSKASGTQW